MQFRLVMLITLLHVHIRCLDSVDIFVSSWVPFCQLTSLSIIDRTTKHYHYFFLEFSILTYALKIYFLKICKCSDEFQSVL